MKIVIGCDHAGFAIKNAVKEYLQSKGHETIDVGTNSNASCHYPVYAHAVCEKIQSGECALGILICGTGIGMSIAVECVPTSTGSKPRDLRCSITTALRVVAA